MSYLLSRTTIGRHAINILVIRLKIEPVAIRGIEKVPDSVLALGQLLGLAAVRWHSPDLQGTAGIRYVSDPSTVGRPLRMIFVARRKCELPRFAAGEIQVK